MSQLRLPAEDAFKNCFPQQILPKELTDVSITDRVLLASLVKQVHLSHEKFLADMRSLMFHQGNNPVETAECAILKMENSARWESLENSKAIVEAWENQLEQLSAKVEAFEQQESDSRVAGEFLRK